MSNAWSRAVGVVGLSVILSALGAGCARDARIEGEHPIADPPRRNETLEDVLRDLAQAEQARALDAARCDDLMLRVNRLATGRKEPDAVLRYDAGVVAQRCERLDVAGAQWRAALALDQAMWPARVALATTDPTLGADGRVRELSRALADSQFRDKIVLLALARAQIARDDRAADSDGADDWARAEKNLKRSLVLDDRYMPALDELARIHLARARRSVGAAESSGPTRGAARPRIPREVLDLALLTCSQAIAKDDRYAPVHVTLGLILEEAGDPGGAARAFDRARKLDPGLRDAHLAYATINLGFRGFEQAEAGFRDALAAPGSALSRDARYDAELGLALALRGQGDGPEGAAKLGEAKRLLEALQAREPDRPEAYFNRAVLLELFGFRDGGPAALEEAIADYRRFVEKARAQPRFARDVAEVTALPSANECHEDCTSGRIYDLQQMIEVVKSG